jgi:DsbC/DsbD-like thiol-disulfide interchange protein/cytochrome c biogenesis protein CcdA
MVLPMSLRPVRLILALCAALCLPAALRAQVKATLVAAETSVHPGRPITVALRLEHQPKWHTYWSYPGTGLPTSLKWTLPAGWTAGEIQWPAPKVIKDATGVITGNGYDGDLLLPVTLTPPANAAPGTTVDLAAVADWLMCADKCVPGTAKLTLSLAIAAGTPAADAAWGPKIAATLADLPRAVDGWKLSAARSAKNILLTVTPAAGTTGSGLSAGDLRFFGDNALVDYAAAQRTRADGTGGFTVRIPVAPDAPAELNRLTGVLVAGGSWLTGANVVGLRVDLPFASVTAGTAPFDSEPVTQGLGATLALALVGGLILNLMPCVFPVLGMKILGFVNQSGHSRGKVAAHGLVFSLGVLLSFWTLAGVLAVLRAGGAELGWGFQLQSAPFVFTLTSVMLVFALNLSGVFEFGLRATSLGGNLQSKSGLAGTFFTGVLATVVATPCSAPFLAPALGAALALPVIESFAVFTAIGVGLSTPYLLLSIFPQAVKILPRPGAWMETFKQFMAFPLYATVVYLLWVLAGQVDESSLLTAGFGLVLVAMAAWAYGRWTTAPGSTDGRRRFGVITALLFLAAGAGLGWPRAVAADAIVWEKWSPEAVAKLRAEGRTVYVDFTARWCATCQANKRLVFHSDDVLHAFAAKKVATLRADWTNQDPQITTELAAYGRSAVPFNQVWLPGKNEPVILPELLSPEIVLGAVGK